MGHPHHDICRTGAGGIFLDGGFMLNLSNEKRQPGEAASTNVRVQPERNGCLPLAARSGVRLTWA